MEKLPITLVVEDASLENKTVNVSTILLTCVSYVSLQINTGTLAIKGYKVMLLNL